MSLTIVHYISLIIAIAISLVPVIMVARKVKSADDYSVGGRKYGVPMVTGTILGTIIGGSSTVGTSQMAFAKGITAWWVTLGAGIALLLMAFFYAKPLRRSRLSTVSQFLTHCFGKKAGAVSSMTVSLGMFFSIIASSITGLHLIAGIFGISLGISAFIIGGLVLCFVFFGGLKGSGTAGLVKLALVAVSIIAGGIWAFFDMGAFSGLKNSFAFDPWLNLYSGGIGDGLYNLTAMIIGVISTQAYVQGVFAAKNLRTAYWGCISAGITIILVGLPSVIIGLYMRQSHPELLPINALPYFLCKYLPDYIGGAGLAAVLFSAAGSVAGLSLGIGTTVSNDIFRNILNINNEKKVLWLNRLTVFAATTGGLIFALCYYDSMVLKWNYLSMATRGLTIFIPLSCLIFFREHVPGKSGLASMLAAICGAMLWKIIFPESKNILFAGLAAALLIMLPAISTAFIKERKLSAHGQTKETAMPLKH